MSWNDLAEARIQEWLRTPIAQRRAAEPPAPARPLDLELLELIERSVNEARIATDPDRRRAAIQRGLEAETRLFALLDATGRSVLAPVMAKRIDELRAAK